MQKLTVITCFSYNDNKKYVLNPTHLRSDLKRIISFSHNKTGCSLDKIYVLTDILPSKNIRNEILEDFQVEVRKILLSCTNINSIHWAGLNQAQWKNIFLGAHHYIERPLKWLKELCKEACHQIRIDNAYQTIYHSLLNQIIPIIRNSNVIEFASLFTKFALITGQEHYKRAMTTIFSRKFSHLFFYYTGHGIKIYPEYNLNKHEVCLVIPNCERESGSVDFCTRSQLQTCFDHILNNVNAIIVFDCCHAEKLLELPSSRTNSQIIYLCSTQNDQTCGFYNSKCEYGSVYTYYLIEFFNLLADELANSRYHSKMCQLNRLYDQVESKVNQYRRNEGKPPQNMYIGRSDSSIEQLPSWLFGRIIHDQLHHDCFNLVET